MRTSSTHKILCAVIICISFYTATYAQPRFNCLNDLRFTRQLPGAASTVNTELSFLNVTPTGVTVGTNGTITNVPLNASVFYDGYVWAMQQSTNTIYKIGSDYTFTTYTIAGLSATGWNNAGVNKNGKMYMLDNGTYNLYEVDLTANGGNGPTAVLKGACTGIGDPSTAGNFIIWGDIVFNPNSDPNTCFVWYHPNNVMGGVRQTLPTGAGGYNAQRGLYKLNINTRVFTPVGFNNDIIMGSLFADDASRLYGYGTENTNAATNQDRFYTIDTATGQPVQYGVPSTQVTQTDGCNCAFRISLERVASVNSLNIPKCGQASFQYIFTTKNFTLAAVGGIVFSDTLDPRLSYSVDQAAFSAEIKSIYGAAATSTFSNFNGGINNLLTISNMNIPLGSKTFFAQVTALGSRFTANAVINQQAFLNGLPSSFGGREKSEYSNTFIPKDATPVTFNVSSINCLPPVSNNFTNIPMPQTNGSTPIPALVSSDADGIITKYTITTIPNAATEGTLFLCNPTCVAVTPGTNILPADIGKLQFDPVSSFTGTAIFNFNATDNSGNVSNTATYRLPVEGKPPVASNLSERTLVNTLGPTYIQPLVAADPDGTIKNYTVQTIPSAAQGVLKLCPTLTTCTDIVAGQVLQPADLINLAFDPSPGFVGNATFNYFATDNNNNISNIANYTIPVSATVVNGRPPLVNNVFAQSVNNSLGATSIPTLRATDVDGTVTSYTINTIPNAATQGTLFLCNPTCVAVTAGQTILPADIDKLKFDPLPSFVGNVSFTYTATDNSSLVGNQAMYTIPIVNNPPTASNITTSVPFNSTQVTIPPIGGSDGDGTIKEFTITNIPPTTQGTLFLCNPTCTAVTTNQVIAPADANKLKFSPATGFTGITNFAYTSTDNNNNISQAASYLISINNQPPIADNIINTAMPQTNGQTTINNLAATDPDGTIASYTILSLPPRTSGLLYFCNPTCVLVTEGQVIAPADVNKLKFDPESGFRGITNFTYNATDNAGNLSNVATYNIPVTATGFNLPPIANNVQTTSMSSSAGATSISSLSATDIDGSITNYTVITLPPASQGILQLCTPTCVNVVAGQVLTPAQAAQLKFTPNVNFSGIASFVFSANDNTSNTSNVANYTIPVTNIPPISNPVVAPSIANNAGSTSIPSLNSSDPDGTIVAYIIETIPPSSQGVLQLCNPTCTNVAVGQRLTAAEAALLKFTPATTYQGLVTFNYNAIDNTGRLSNTAPYSITVTGQPPVSQDILAPKLLNSLSATPIPGLNSTDVDGTISSYVIHNIPPSNQGILLLCTPACTPIVPGQVLTATQFNQLQFDPNAGQQGIAIFNYSAFDNNGNQSNIANYTIPIGTLTTLPIDGLTISGSNVSAGTQLTWKTLNETADIKYELEWSTDGLTFTKIFATLSLGAGNNVYSYLHPTSNNGNQFYRVKAIDKDGTIKFSNIILLNKNSNATSIVKAIYPVPAKSVVNIALSRAGIYDILVTDASGKTMQYKNNIQAIAQQVIQWQRNNLANGVYIIKIIEVSTKETYVSTLVYQ